jgi:hypothetical protein
VNWYYANQEQLSGVESGCSRTGWLSNSSKRQRDESACSYQDAIALGQQANQA